MTLQEVNDTMPWVLQHKQLYALSAVISMIILFFCIMWLISYFVRHKGKKNLLSKISCVIVPCLSVSLVICLIHGENVTSDWVLNYGEPFIDENSDSYTSENVSNIDITPNDEQADVTYLSINQVIRASIPYQVKEGIEKPYVAYQITEYDFSDMITTMPKQGEEFNEILYIPPDF